MANDRDQHLSSGSAFWIIFRRKRLLTSWSAILPWRGDSANRVRSWALPHVRRVRAAPVKKHELKTALKAAGRVA
jgi:hypothetical protein